MLMGSAGEGELSSLRAALATAGTRERIKVEAFVGRGRCPEKEVSVVCMGKQNHNILFVQIEVTT
jgi:hypothetical protein